VRFYNVSWLGERVTADLRNSTPVDAAPAFYEATRTGRSDFAPHQRHDDAGSRHRLVGTSMATRNLTCFLVGGLAMRH
jgi:ATP-binding cassette subfamily B protein